MQAPEYDLMREVEDRHWWYAVLRGLVDDALAGRLGPRARVLDAGCGTGGMLDFLRGRNGALALAGVDASAQAVQHCRQRGLGAVQAGAVEALPFADAAFDAVLSLDVLYHACVDEGRALAEMGRVLRTDGMLVLNLPAFEGLRGSHDTAVQGARRYEAGRLRALLARHGFDTETMQYWNAWLFLPLLLWRRMSRWRTTPGAAVASDLNLTPGWLNPLLAGVGRLDAGLCQELGLPFGTSLFAVARKTSPVQERGAA